MGKKAVLLNTGFDYPRYDSHLQTCPPLGILSLGTFLTEHGVPVELIDVQMDFGFGLTYAAEHIVCERVVHYLVSQRDAIAWIGISQLSNVPSGVVLAQEIRAALPDIPIVFGGYFPSCNYQFLLHKYPFITAIVRGDGETAALQISRSLAQGQSFLSDQTPNLAWLDSGEIRATPIQPVDLNGLPILDFRLMRNLACYQFAVVMTSRGCPFNCNYCLESRMRPYAAYPAEWVTRQLDHLEAELSCTHIGIFDPIFGVGRKRILDMCQAMRGRRFTYVVESRVDVLPPDLIPLLGQAGVEVIFWGLESASPATLQRMNKVHSEARAADYLNDARKVIKACLENKVIPFLGLMLGFPGDSEADLQATLKFVKEAESLSQGVAQTGVETGFAPLPMATSIYHGSSLAERIAQDFPHTLVSATPFDGESAILSSSSEVGADVIGRYEEEIGGHGHYTSRVSELLNFYFPVPKDWAAAHPELTDEQDVTVLCSNLRRFPNA